MKPPAPDVTPVLEAIEAARERMLPLKGVDLACAAVDEMKNIILAKTAYDEQVVLAAQAKMHDQLFDALAPFFGEVPFRP